MTDKIKDIVSEDSRDLGAEVLNTDESSVATLRSEPESQIEQGCQCNPCKQDNGHASDCAVHNEPAMPNGECDCFVKYHNLFMEMFRNKVQHYRNNRNHNSGFQLQQAVQTINFLIDKKDWNLFAENCISGAIVNHAINEIEQLRQFAAKKYLNDYAGAMSDVLTILRKLTIEPNYERSVATKMPSEQNLY